MPCRTPLHSPATFCACTLGLLIASFAPSPEAANGLAPLFNISLMLLSGFLININSLPDGAKWCPHASFLRWCFQSLCKNEFTGLTFTCTAGYPCISTGEVMSSSLNESHAVPDAKADLCETLDCMSRP